MQHQVYPMSVTRRTETMEVKLIRSPDRKKTIQAKMVGNTLVVHLPLGLHREEERKFITEMKEKSERKLHTQQGHNSGISQTSGYA